MQRPGDQFVGQSSPEPPKVRRSSKDSLTGVSMPREDRVGRHRPLSAGVSWKGRGGGRERGREGERERERERALLDVFTLNT